jgi:glycosidase
MRSDNPAKPGEPGFFASVRDRALAPILTEREADWRIGPVVYQVFVDRFAPSANLEAKRSLYDAPRILRDWADKPRRGHEVKEVGYWTHELDFWGGDLPSLKGKLDYIQGLGVDVLYLNPIQQALTNHKYDAQDYFAIAPEYGTKEDFRALTEALDQRGINLVLDGVLNHMGRTAPMFQDALKNPDSPWREWFYIGPQYKKGYRSWIDVANLPDVNWESPTVRARLFEDADSLIRGYLAQGVDGWRLDVAHDIGFSYLAMLREAARKTKPDALILGEIFHYPEEWLQAVDAQLNMTLGDLIIHTAKGEVSPRQAADLFERMIEDTDYNGLLRSWIVLDNHDRPRLAHRIPSLERRKVAQVLQFTLPGSPNIYYGAELGFDGGEDPENREAMDWSLATPENPNFVWMQTLIKARKDSRGLRIGEYRRLDAQHLIAFTRFTDRIADFTVVVANPTDEPQSEYLVLRDSKISSENMICAVSGTVVRVFAGTLRITVPPRTAYVLRPQLNVEGREHDFYKRVQ